MPKGKRHLKFRVGDLVRVKHGVADIDFPDIPMGGWVGRISKNGNGTHLVRWVIETLEQVHPVYRKRCERLGADYQEILGADGRSGTGSRRGRGSRTAYGDHYPAPLG